MAKPQHVPTPETRRVVEVMTACGNTVVDVGKALGISENTVPKYYQEELDCGRQKRLSRVKMRLFDIAENGEPRYAVSACCFILKTQDGWREKADVELIQSEIESLPNVAALLGQLAGDPEKFEEVFKEYVKIQYPRLLAQYNGDVNRLLAALPQK